MRHIANSNALKTVNFIVGFALLVMLAPKHGVPSDKPAGVRTAIELVGKKQSSFRDVAALTSAI